jgi:hypothetical protein
MNIHKVGSDNVGSPKLSRHDDDEGSATFYSAAISMTAAAGASPYTPQKKMRIL